MVDRRWVIGAGGGILAGLLLPRFVVAAPAKKIVEIRMRGNKDGSKVWFDPVGIRIQPGQTVRWINGDPGNSHTATAYHPKNEDHSLRIPEGAQSWNSDYLLPKEHFDLTLTVPGVYDYFCIPHEMAGMVGRIVVGEPAGPGTQPLDYFKQDPDKRSWREVPEVAQKVFPPVDAIMRQGSIKGG